MYDDRGPAWCPVVAATLRGAALRSEFETRERPLSAHSFTLSIPLEAHAPPQHLILGALPSRG